MSEWDEFDLTICLERFRARASTFGLSVRDIAVELRKLADTLDEMCEEHKRYTRGK